MAPIAPSPPFRDAASSKAILRQSDDSDQSRDYKVRAWDSERGSSSQVWLARPWFPPVAAHQTNPAQRLILARLQPRRLK